MKVYIIYQNHDKFRSIYKHVLHSFKQNNLGIDFEYYDGDERFSMKCKDRLYRDICSGRKIYTIQTTLSKRWSVKHPILQNIKNWSTEHNNCTRVILDSGFFGIHPRISISFNDIKNHGLYFPLEVNNEERLIKNNIKLHPWKRSGSTIIILAQQIDGSGVSGITPDKVTEIYSNCVNYILKNTSYKILWKCHPNNTHLPKQVARLRDKYGPRFKMLCSEKVKNNREHRKQLQETFLNNDILCSVVISSNAAISSLVYGIPVISLSDRCIARDFSNHNIQNLSNITYFDQADVHKFLCKLSYCEWELEELVTYSPIQHAILKHASE